MKAYAGVRPRTIGGRRTRETFLIVCEGSKTEPQYFKAFKLSSADVQVVGLGKNTKSLVEAALRLREEREPRDHYWCVFDRDSFPANDFNASLDMARAHEFNIAYSNEAFEIWYLLHFDYIDAALSREQYADKLTDRLGRKYKKNDPEIFDLLRDRQKAAIRNATKLIESHGEAHSPERDNPCTTVHDLVKKLNQQLDT